MTGIKYYENFMIVDDGTSDSIGKNYLFRRDDAGTYTAVVAFSRDLPRVAWNTQTDAPLHLKDRKN